MRRLFDTVLTFLRRWESDKWIHVVAFLLLAWLVARVSSLLLPLVWPDGDASGTVAAGMMAMDTVATLIGAVVAAVMAVAKEGYDEETEGLFDWQDLWASWVGVGLFLMMSVV